jgi:[acyl-carrier-protein] S-malonyltransferase
VNKTALLFPGQGSQYVGMGKSICEKFPVAKQTFEEANDALGFDLQKLCFEGDINELTKTENTQPAILTSSVAAFKVYMQEIGIVPEYTAGHSLGEFSALCCAGAIGFYDAVRIVRNRGKFMQEAVAVGVGSMAAISGIDQSIIEDECSKISNDGHIVVISNYNSPDQIVISGHINAVSSAGEKLKAMGARVTPLKVSAPFHSPLMKPAADRLKEELLKYAFNDLKWNVISNVTANPYPNQDKIIEYLSMQIVQPVRWQASMEYLQKQKDLLAIEMGPRTVLKNLMSKNAPNIKTISFDSENDLQAVRTQLSQIEQKVLDNTMAVLTKCIAITVCTKNRNWDNDEYQKGVVEPYRQIQSMKDTLEKEGRQPTTIEAMDALEKLRLIFITKRTPIEEQVERFNQIFDETGLKGLFPDFKMPG